MILMKSAVELEREYLIAVLSWLDARLEHAVRRWQAAGQNPADRFRGLVITDDEALALTQKPAASHWGSGVALPDEVESRLASALSFAEHRKRSMEDEAQQGGITLRLLALKQTFGLDEFDWWALMICLAPALDLRYERIFSYLQDDVTRVHPGADLILTLLLPDDLGRLDYLQRFDCHAPLRQFNLIQPIEDANRPPNPLRQAFQAAPSLLAWLLDAYQPPLELGEGVDFIPAPGAQDEPEEDIFATPLMPGADIFADVHPFVTLHGGDFFQQAMAARRLASAMRRPLLSVTVSAEAEIASALIQLSAAVRDARMLKALLLVQGADSLIDRDGCLHPAVFRVLRLADDSVLFSSRQPFKFSDEMLGNDYPLMLVPFNRLTAGERAELWGVMLEDIQHNIPAQDFSVLAGQFVLTSGQIVAAASTAMSLALQSGRGLQSSDLFQAARIHSGHHLADLAQKIEPRYVWEDLVLPDTPLHMLREMVDMVQSRPLVLEQWGLGHKLTASNGISALFTGQPGTGKTLAAQIMAHELGLDVYRIDLSTVVSKYIGETEKNLERIFNEAQTSNAILFFDEADAIFGKRSEVKDAHDRYANIEVGYLLQRMEAYDGVAILATNLRANLDEAFTRRLQFIINFPFPDEEYRLRIWQVLLPPGLPRGDDLNLPLLAKRFKLAGGSIRNIIVSAAYLAANDGGSLRMKHLMHGARREFQKMGRLIQEADFTL